MMMGKACFVRLTHLLPALRPAARQQPSTRACELNHLVVRLVVGADGHFSVHLANRIVLEIDRIVYRHYRATRLCAS